MNKRKIFNSSQLDLQIQHNPNQNHSNLFYRYWPTGSEVYMERQNIQNTQFNIKRNKLNWKTDTKLQDLL